MKPLPSQAYLPNYQTRFPKICQYGFSWCIPASIENVTKYLAIPNITQDRLVISYCRKFGNGSLAVLNYSIDPTPLSDGLLILVARKCALVHANFKTFKQILESYQEFQISGWQLNHIKGINSPQQYLDEIKDAISSGYPILISFDNGQGGSHIISVAGYDQNNLEVHDPANNQLVPVPICKFTFREDLLLFYKQVDHVP